LTTVYVSATHADLADCRKAILLATRRLGLEDVSMESYVARDQMPLDKCLEDVARCDYYIGLFAWRYGFTPPGQDISITESEYRQAKALSKPCLIFLLDEDAPWPGSLFDRGVDGDRIMKLRRELAETHMCSFFRGPDDLAASATAALANLRNGDPLPRPPGRGAVTARSVSTQETWQAYYARLRECYMGVELDALTPPPSADYLKIPLTSVFLEPAAREDARPETPREGWRRTPLSANGLEPLDAPDASPSDLTQVQASYQAKPSSRLLELITDPTHRTTVLLGDPGAGKSAVVRYLALCLAGARDDPRLAALAGYVPLLVELRSYVGMVGEGRCEDFIDYLDVRSRDHLGIARSELAPYLENDGAALVLFDGLDEIFEPRRREEVANQIAAFAATYPTVRVLVTARIVGYSRRTLSDAGFDHFTLEDLDEAQIAEFLRRWYEWVIPDSPDEAKVLRERMLAAIRNSPAMRELAGNPLLLSILAIIGKNQELPKERWDLYDHAANVLVEYWEADRHLRKYYGDSDFIDTDDKKKLLRRLAYRMQSQQRGLNANYIGRDQLSRLFEDYLVERYEHPRAVAHQLANSMIEQFHQRNFILGRYGQDVYGFVHRTFLEFFYAQSVVRKFEQRDPEWPMEQLKALFADHWADPSWREVLRLVASALDVEVAGSLIRLLTNEVNRPWPPDEFPEPPWNLALATQCLAEVRDPTQMGAAAEPLLRQLILLIEHGVSIEDRSTAELIEAEILPSVRVIGSSWPARRVFLHWYRRRGIRVSWTTGSSFATQMAVLLAAPHEGIEDLLETTLGASNDRRARLALIAGLAESAALPATPNGRSNDGRRARCRTLLVEHVQKDNHGAVRLAALEALIAQYGLDVPLSELLDERARSDTYSAVRLVAVKTLGGRRNMDEQTRALLMELAHDDPDGPVRQAAIEAVAGRSTGQDDIRDLLIDRVRSDVRVGVFEAAALALLDRPDSISHVRSLLVKRVRRDSKEVGDAIRRSAARLLGEWFTDYDMRELLLDLAREDNDPGTRGAAVVGLIRMMDGGAELRGLLIDLIMRDDDANLRLTAQRTLVERFRSDPAVGELLARQAQMDRDAAVRRAAALDLAEHFGNAATMTILIELAKADNAAGVRLATAEALAEHFGAHAGTRTVIIEQAETERDTIVRLAAVRALIRRDADGEIHDRLLDRVRNDPEPQVIREAAAALIRWPAYKPLVFASLRDRTYQDSYAGVRLAAIEILVGSSATDPVLAGLFVDRARDDSDPAVFRAAVVALVEHFGGGQAVEQLLIERAKDDHTPIRLPAIELLGRHFGDDAEVRALLVDRARNDQDVQVRRAAVRVLGDELAAHAEVRALLRDLIMDVDWSLRCTAVHALGKHFGVDDDLRAFFHELASHDPNPDFRRVVGQALTWLPDADPDQLPDITDVG
jgi:hypothetical protein